jgi:dTDP-4-dehydrorhamnose reductase
MLDLARDREELKVVDDQIGKPNWSRSIAEATASIIGHAAARKGKSLLDAIGEASGVYHLCGEDETSRFGFAEEIIALYRRRMAVRELPPLQVKRLTPVSSAEFSSPARRPLYSVLSSEKMTQIFGVRMPSWRAQLAAAFEEMSFGAAR